MIFSLICLICYDAALLISTPTVFCICVGSLQQDAQKRPRQYLEHVLHSVAHCYFASTKHDSRTEKPQDRYVDAATLLMSSSPSVSGNCKPLAEESLDILSGGFELGPASILRDTIAFLGDVVSAREVFGGH